MPVISFKEAIRQAQEQLLKDDKVILIGEGVPDPKGCFGSTIGLNSKFPKQVFDMPVSENGLTGVCIGASINGLKPILVHQRIDFSLYSLDQIVGNAAKWFSMFGGQGGSCPIVIRMLVGRGWGAGNQHSQNLTSLFAHIPGLIVLCPSNAADAKGLLISAVRNPNPVIFIEHRWLYETTSDVQDGYYETPIGVCKADPGEDITIVASGHAYREAYQAREWLAGKGIFAELIDLRTIKPLPIHYVLHSVEKTGRLLVVDDCWKTCGLAGEIIAEVVCQNHAIVCQRLTYPDYPSASSPALTVGYYPDANRIVRTVGRMMRVALPDAFAPRKHHDVPNEAFRGPF